jgi:hypothetical protein
LRFSYEALRGANYKRGGHWKDAFDQLETNFPFLAAQVNKDDHAVL